MTATVSFQCCSWEELTLEQQTLVQRAIAATQMAYAPYSGLRVGAAVENSEGAVFVGSNQENISFGAGVCAERAVLYGTDAAQSQRLVRLAVASTKTGIVAPIAPCGICRQSLLEVELRQGAPIEVLFLHKNKYIVAASVRNLLPFSFESF